MDPNLESVLSDYYGLKATPLSNGQAVLSNEESLPPSTSISQPPFSSSSLPPSELHPNAQQSWNALTSQILNNEEKCNVLLEKILLQGTCSQLRKLLSEIETKVKESDTNVQILFCDNYEAFFNGFLATRATAKVLENAKEEGLKACSRLNRIQKDENLLKENLTSKLKVLKKQQQQLSTAKVICFLKRRRKEVREMILAILSKDENCSSMIKTVHWILSSGAITIRKRLLQEEPLSSLCSSSKVLEICQDLCTSAHIIIERVKEKCLSLSNNEEAGNFEQMQKLWANLLAVVEECTIFLSTESESELETFQLLVIEAFEKYLREQFCEWCLETLIGKGEEILCDQKVNQFELLLKVLIGECSKVKLATRFGAYPNVFMEYFEVFIMGSSSSSSSSNLELMKRCDSIIDSDFLQTSESETRNIKRNFEILCVIQGVKDILRKKLGPRLRSFELKFSSKSQSDEYDKFCIEFTTLAQEWMNAMLSKAPPLLLTRFHRFLISALLVEVRLLTSSDSILYVCGDLLLEENIKEMTNELRSELPPSNSFKGKELEILKFQSEIVIPRLSQYSKEALGTPLSENEVLEPVLEKLKETRNSIAESLAVHLRTDLELQLRAFIDGNPIASATEAIESFIDQFEEKKNSPYEVALALKASLESNGKFTRSVAAAGLSMESEIAPTDCDLLYLSVIKAFKGLLENCFRTSPVFAELKREDEIVKGLEAQLLNCLLSCGSKRAVLELSGFVGQMLICMHGDESPPSKAAPPPEGEEDLRKTFSTFVENFLTSKGGHHQSPRSS